MSDSTPFRHIVVEGRRSAERYTYAGPTPRGELPLPPRDRASHGSNIREQLTRVRQQNEQLRGGTAATETPARIILEVRSEPAFELAFDKLDPRSQGVELACVREEGGQRIAVIHVPEGRLGYFVRRVEQYLTEQSASGKPRNQDLIDRIGEIRLATLRSFWTEEGRDFPPADERIWWEVWLRAEGDQSPWDRFQMLADAAGIQPGKDTIRFPDRLVGLCDGTANQLSSSVEILDLLGEVREAKENPAAFISMPARDQVEYVDALRARVAPPAPDAPAVCLLESGVVLNPLLLPALDPADCLRYDPTWPLTDSATHGTEMAGVSLYGDRLADLLAGNDPVVLRHRLESVKILPPQGANPHRLYGAITAQAAYAIENHAERQRVFCMAITTDGRDRGKPSSWSGEVDQLCAGVNSKHRRLLVISAGNTDGNERHRYPDSNDTDPVQDPAQAWNAITVGAFTNRVQFPQAQYPDHRPVARAGDLGPSSTTSLTWFQQWPYKPDIVLEGGNEVVHPNGRWSVAPDQMAMVTTAHATTGRLLVDFRDTSAATAQAARMAATIQAEYPDYWPETVRGLLIHSAEWTAQMRQAFNDCDPPVSPKDRCARRLRRYGYGVPDLGRALACARNSLTLIVQDCLQPFHKDGGDIKTKDMHVHALPWPKAELEALSEKPVNLRVTLSYFIEPKPGRRGGFARTRHRYQSHGLRFEVRRPQESLDDLRGRVSKAARDADEKYESVGDTKGWVLGPNLRTRGSIHSDCWQGAAAELASCGHIVVYPVTGWWREANEDDCWSRQTRYALVVSILTEETSVDLYSPVLQQVQVPVTLEASVEVE